MKVGSIESPIGKTPSKRPAWSQFPGGGNGGGNGWNGAGGDDDDETRIDTDEQSTNPDKSKIIAWFLLLVVLMTFGGMIGAYIVLATNGAAEWRPFDLPGQVWISTLLIISGSFTYHLAQKALFASKFDRSRNLLIATTALGAAFISSQLIVWLALVNRGFYLSGNPYAGFFYILTAVHAVHVIGGIVALGTILLRTWNPARSEDENLYRRSLAQSVGWYWHFMGALWLVLLVLLGFWK